MILAATPAFGPSVTRMMQRSAAVAARSAAAALIATELDEYLPHSLTGSLPVTAEALGLVGSMSRVWRGHFGSRQLRAGGPSPSGGCRGPAAACTRCPCQAQLAHWQAAVCAAPGPGPARVVGGAGRRGPASRASYDAPKSATPRLSASVSWAAMTRTNTRRSGPWRLC